MKIHRSPVPRLLVPLAVLLVVLLTACGAKGGKNTDEQFAVQKYSDGLVVVTASESDPDGATHQALLEGLLTASPDGCLTVLSPGGPDDPGPVHLVLPPGANVSKSLPLRINFNGKERALGDRVSFSGGFSIAETIRSSHPEYPAKCGAAEIFVAGKFDS